MENINKTRSSEKHDSSREGSINSLPEGELAVAESQKRMTHSENCMLSSNTLENGYHPERKRGAF